MRRFKLFSMFVAVIALGAITAASSSAATFTASATGTLHGKALNTHVFTTNAGKVECKLATTKGSIVSTATAEQHVTVEYSSCTFLGFTADVSTATYLFTANGTVHVKNTITINVTAAGCHFTVGLQTLGGITYTNVLAAFEHTGRIKVAANVTGIIYSATGSLCGKGGTAGTYTGDSEIERVNGGSLTFDP